MVELEVLLREADELEPLPDSAARLAALLADEDWVLEDLVEVIELDPALTGRLLNRVNSVSGGSRVPILSARQATTRVGPGVVLSLALSSVIRDQMQVPLSAYGLSEGELWRHSVASALAAEQARKHCSAEIPPQGFAAALLHDIGKLVLGRYMRDEIAGMLDGVQDWEDQPTMVEIESLASGVHHAGFGGLVARNWSLPDSIARGIEYHHHPEEAPEEESRRIASLVSVANLVAHQVVGSHDASRAAVPRESMELLGLTRQGFHDLCEATDKELERALEFYD